VSHNAKFEVVIKDIPTFQQAIRNTGGTVFTKEKTFKAYYGDRIDCEFTFTAQDYEKSCAQSRMTQGYNRIALVKESSGAYALRYDAWGINLRNKSGAENPVACFGDNFGRHRTEGGVHYPLPESTPDKLLREYACLTAEKYAKQNFMRSRREVKLDGSITVVLSGGNLKGSEQIHVIANADGSTTMAAVGFKGKRCEKATKPLEDILGVKVSDERLGDYFHEEDGTHIRMKN
jgi:hypothetical protein